MKLTRNILAVVVLVALTIIITGCAAQDAGEDTKLLGWDENGPYLLKRKTNGSQVVVGKNVKEINTTFNETTKKKHNLMFIEKLAEGKTPVITNPEDVGSVVTSVKELNF